MAVNVKNKVPTTKDDFKSDQVVKWCAGCGDFAILSAIQSALVESGVRKEDAVFVSGIGCSGRTPIFINSYGFHTLHGRSIPVATGLKLAREDLTVFAMAGDGDALGIGGGHLPHVARKNIDITFILFEPRGSITKTSPDGTIENAFKPGELTMGAQGTFFARVVDTEPKRMKEVFLEASKHRGTSVVEVLQNCVIFNNRIHSAITGKDVRDDHQIHLVHGKPMIFGKQRNKGLILRNSRLEVVTIGENGVTEKDLLVHDVHNPDDTTHYMLVRMTLPEYPVATGVIRSCEQFATYEAELEAQIANARQKSSMKSLQDLIEKNAFTVGE